MLQAAGFVSVTEPQLQAYLGDGAALPRHSVLIAFDGGRERDWTVADGLLAHYGFTATVFVDPARLAGRGSGYLSWTQLEQMASSGRWSVGLDLGDAGATVPARRGRDASARPSCRTPGCPPRTGPRRRPSSRPESAALLQRRDRRPHRARPRRARRWSMYPFDATLPAQSGDGGIQRTDRVVNSTVDAGLLRISPDAAVSDFYRRERLLPVLPVFSTTTTDGLFARIVAATS